VYAFNNAVASDAITVAEVLAKGDYLNDKSGSLRKYFCNKDGINFAPLKQAVEGKYGDKYQFRRVPAKTEKSAAKWLPKQEGVFMVLEYTERNGKYHWVAVRAGQVLVSALKNPKTMKAFVEAESTVISRIYKIKW